MRKRALSTRDTFLAQTIGRSIRWRNCEVRRDRDFYFSWKNPDRVR